MGGVLAFWHENKDVMNKELFDSFVDSLKHRGPDSRDTYRDKEANLWLGNRRLKTLDPGFNGQMNSFNNRYQISFNGSIYNFIEIKKKLQSVGYTFNTECDTEVLLKSYIHWGEDCQFELNGIWAFAIWDNLNKKLFISRDRFGVKPLHYYFDSRCFALASELKSFMQLPFLDVEFDSKMMILGMNYQCHLRPDGHTILKNVYQLEPGHCGVFDTKSKSFKIRKWWDTLDHLHAVPTNEEDIVEQFRELFLDAVKIRMRTDASMGCLVSGGVDSTSIFCGMNHLKSTKNLPERCAPSWNNAYIASYPNTTFDEGYLAQEIAQSVGANITNINIDPTSAVDEFEKMIYHSEELFEFPIGPWVMYKSMKENGIDICMDGEGGDDIFVGFHHQVLSLRNTYRRHPLKYLDLNRIYNEMHEHMDAPKVKFRRKIKDFLKTPIPQKSFSDQLDPINSNVYEAFLKNVHFGMRNWDRIAMSQGIENRAPIRDWRLTCFVFSLPGKWKIGGGYTKTLFRKAMKGLLPDKVRLKKGKLGFANPNEQWGEKGWYQYFLDRVSSQHFLENPLWDGQKVRQDVLKAYEEKRYGSITLIAMGYVVGDHLVNSFEKERQKALALV